MKMSIIALFSASLLTLGTVNAADLPVLAHFNFEHDGGSQAITDAGPSQIIAKMTAQNPDSAVVTEPGQIGKALRFSAKDKMHFTIPRKSMTLAPPYTIAFWAKPDTAYTGMYVVGNKGDAAPHQGVAVRLFFGMLDFRFGDGDKQTIVQSPRHSAPQKVFQHYAVVNDGKTVTLYINAEAIKKLPSENTAGTPAIRDITIGSFYWNFAYQYEGLLDELYFIGKALSADELLDLANPAE